jgi:Rad3-related DNA helicase
MDEAHNIDRVAADVASFELNIGILNMALAELSKLKNLVETTQDKKQYVSHVKHLNEIITMTKNIQAHIRDYDLQCSKRL